jgi:hypothetical protein
MAGADARMKEAEVCGFFMKVFRGLNDILSREG